MRVVQTAILPENLPAPSQWPCLSPKYPRAGQSRPESEIFELVERSWTDIGQGKIQSNSSVWPIPQPEVPKVRLSMDETDGLLKTCSGRK